MRIFFNKHTFLAADYNHCCWPNKMRPNIHFVKQQYRFDLWVLRPRRFLRIRCFPFAYYGSFPGFWRWRLHQKCNWTLQNDDSCCSQTPAPENLLIEREWVPSSSDNEFNDEFSQSERSIRKQRTRKRKKRTPTIPSTSSNGIDNISEVNDDGDESNATMICIQEPRTRPSIILNNEIGPEVAVGSNVLEEPKEIHWKEPRKRYECRICHKFVCTNTARIDHENII